MGIVGTKDYKISILGLDASGKTTLLYRLKLGEVVTTVPTIGFNVERISYKKYSLLISDVGGQKALRKYWEDYTKDLSCLIYVIDSTDQERIEEAKEELFRLLELENLTEMYLLLYANKRNKNKAALDIKEIEEKMELNRLANPWKVQPCNAITGEGLYEGLDWIVQALEGKVESVSRVLNVKSAQK
eukprot:CAMPEP_0201481968 /NCGR_PEP_ID=MMETSP0151_2-20130828/6223_1 /ASSEMBLY_ACC=CAM_ASM_000257 /TAXON_ID=200890 /ORGANISM="Paramoeba atlantica, Strain 621/1 / CCAP 1560/9" /LENGTH=186 /DNA_ID=CAMNT_0047864413 /DNA_START=146 /DNA_END=706 /DNA_ORIENTATION=-